MCKYFKQIVRTALEKGGVLTAGLGCLYLYKKKLIPKVFGPVSYGLISFGTIGIARFVIMSVQTKLTSGEEEMPGDILEGISDKLNIEMRKEEILERLRDKVIEKQTQKESEKDEQLKESEKDEQQKESEKDELENPQPETSPDKGQQKDSLKQPDRINIVEQYFSGYEECLKNNDLDDYEAIEIPAEEFEAVPKHLKKSDK